MKRLRECLKIHWKNPKHEIIFYLLIGGVGTLLVLLLWEAFWWAIGGHG